MSESTFTDALRRSKAELIKAIMERDKLNLEIIRLQQLVRALTYQAHKAEQQIAVDTPDVIGFTEAVLTIVRNSKDELTARDVRNRLMELGYELGKYSNPLGFVHSVLGRLESQGKIRQPAPGTYAATTPFYRALWQSGLDAIEGSASLVLGDTSAKPKASVDDVLAAFGFGQAKGTVAVPGGLTPPPRIDDEKSRKK